MLRIVAPGDIHVMVGGPHADIRLRGGFRIAGPKRLLVTPAATAVRGN